MRKPADNGGQLLREMRRAFEEIRPMSMFEFEIDAEAVSKTATPQPGAEVFSPPRNRRQIGRIEQSDLCVCIRRRTYEDIDAFSKEDASNERGGILIGESGVDASGKTHLVISDFIEARYTDATASSLTFTHRTWAFVHAERERRFPTKRIVGWQHTHPGYGVFLSSYDLFIHENFFDLPDQVAYVVDPKQEICGFFQWKNGKVEKLNGFCVYGE
jgi:proteasome lid subunit RPN8/RPN11